MVDYIPFMDAVITFKTCFLDVFRILDGFQFFIRKYLITLCLIIFVDMVSG